MLLLEAISRSGGIESLWKPLMSLHLREPHTAADFAVQHVIYFVIHVLSHILTMEAEETKHVNLPSIPSVILLASVAFSITAIACSQIGIQVLLFATFPLGYRLYGKHSAFLKYCAVDSIASTSNSSAGPDLSLELPALIASLVTTFGAIAFKTQEMSI